MAQKNKAALTIEAAEIRDEVLADANTATRVGTHMVNNIDSNLNAVETSDQSIASNLSISKQAKGGDSLEIFSATKTFDMDDGNMQKMIITSNITSLAISNEVNGSSYLIVLEMGGSGSYTIPTAGASFGTRTDNSVDDSGGAGTWEPTTVGSKIIYTINVEPDGDTHYSIETITI